MTVIAGYDDGKTVAIAADTQEQTSVIRFRGRDKLHQLGPCWVGAAGAGLWHDFLISRSHDGMPDTISPDPAVWRQACVALAEDWLAWAKERNHGTSEDGSWYVDGSMIVATPGGLFAIDCTGSVRHVHGYHAIGSGTEVAMGALFALVRVTAANPALCVQAAVDAAIRHAPGCGGEVVCQVVERATVEKP